MATRGTSSGKAPVTLGRGGTKPPPKPVAAQYQVYNQAVKDDAATYGDLSGAYRDLFNQISSQNKSPYTPEVYTPTTYNYAPSADYTAAASKYRDLADTGGYRENELQALRERGVSPIRAAYTNANREIDRRASITGRSASYAALKAKMAREQSQQMADSLNDVNAGIAEKVASGRREGIAGYAGMASQENAIRNQYGAGNVATQNDASKFNVGNRNQAKQFSLTLDSQNKNNMMGILDALRSLYGTQPGRSSLYGSQANTAANTQFNINQSNRNFGMDQLQQLLAGLR